MKSRDSDRKSYDPAGIEKKWQTVWEKEKIYQAKDPQETSDKKFYALIEFPYPSGDGLHVGHVRSDTAMDVIARKRRREGYNVLYPIGWDAFGLPTENYAIKTGIQPAAVTKTNSDNFRRQLKSLGFSFDWSREINTTDPKYYKWTQWIFLQFLKAGLAYKKKMAVNWCPKDLIVLANEEVVDGKCDRCGTPVEKREKEQWMLAITRYADKLLEGLDAVDYGSDGAGDYVMPKFIDKVNPHQPGKPVVKRHVAHAIVFDPRDKKYLIIRNKKFGWDTVVIGGVENGESVVETARREVREETGYVDLEFKRILGGPTESQYYTKHKGENRVAIAQAVYFELKSDERVPIADVDDKDKSNEILWVSVADFKPGKMVNSELPIWLARMSVEVGNQAGSGVLCFTDVSADFGYREGMPVVERNAIAAVVKHWSEDKYIGLKWKKVDWQTIITGGPEGDQTPEEGAAAEIIEETGYLHPKFVRRLGWVDSRFFHVPKNVNRYAHFDLMYFELNDSDRRALSAEESAIHDVVWLTREEMSEFISPAAQKYMWDTLFLGKPNWFAPGRPLLDWPESIKESQRNWIGRSEGMIFTAPIKNSDMTLQTFSAHFEAFAADTFVVIAPDHPFLKELIKGTKQEKKVLDFAAKIVAERISADREEIKNIKGIFTGRYIVDPVGNGDLPIWVASYALADYGTGIVKCSAHDERDFAFAKKYDIRLKPVLFPQDPIFKEKVCKLEICFADMEKGILTKPQEFAGKYARESREAIITYLEKNKLAKKKTTYKLRDWVFSRQRYWGEPIPVIHCKKCGIVPVPDKDLPVELPPVKNYKPTETGESPLAAISAWVNVACPQCGGKAKRETDTMPNWAGSSWYYLRYTDPKNAKAFAAPDKLAYWTPVDWYDGGNEHTTLHLLYSRFWHRFLYDQGLVPTPEPYRKRTVHGFILAKGGEKMSKSKGNVVNPDSIVETVGADSLRLYEMFMGPFDQAIVWDDNGIVGTRRFIEKVWKLRESVGIMENIAEGKGEKVTKEEKIERVIHSTIQKVSEDIEATHFNTAISALMIAVNAFESFAKENAGVDIKDYETILLLLAPFAPHVTEELWHNLGHKTSIHAEPWPTYNPAKILSTKVRIAVQINGKTRGTFEADADSSESVIRQKALTLDEIKSKVYGKDIKKVIYVKRRLINIVID